MFSTGFYSYDEKEFRDPLRNGQTNRQEESATALEAIQFLPSVLPVNFSIFTYQTEGRTRPVNGYTKTTVWTNSINGYTKTIVWTNSINGEELGYFRRLDMSRVFKLLPAFLLLNCAFYHRLGSMRVLTVADEPNAICLTI
jgi:hypothetical protein